MANFNQLSIQFLLFLSLLTFITSEIIWVDYQPSTFSATYKHNNDPEKVVVAVDFHENIVP